LVHGQLDFLSSLLCVAPPVVSVMVCALANGPYSLHKCSTGAFSLNGDGIRSLAGFFGLLSLDEHAFRRWWVFALVHDVCVVEQCRERREGREWSEVVAMSNWSDAQTEAKRHD
jgi:hypothetical protein